MIETIFSMPLYIIMPVVLIGYSAACFGVGTLFLKLFTAHADWMEQISAGTILATGFILGQGILASIWLLLALGGWFSIRFVGVLCFIFAVGGLYIGRSLFSALKKQIISIWHELRADTWGWQLIAGLTITLCLLWVTSLGRPLGGDGLAFYFALGKFVAASHRLVPLPGYEVFTNVGLQGEMHFAALMALHSPEAAKLFSWPTITAAGIMLAALGRVAGMGRRGQWLTLSILFSSSAVIWLSGDGKVDLFATSLGLAAYYWAVQIRFVHTKMVLLLTGLFSGFSIIAKLSYAPVMVPTIALLILWGYESEFRNKDQWRAVLKPFISGCMLILAGLILAFIPHFVKNGLLYHNPISPIGSHAIGWLNQTWFGPDVTRRILLTYPLALTYGSYWSQYGNLSPLILAFLPLIFYLPRPRPFFSSPLVVITLIALAGVLSWIIYNPSVFSPRYILAVLLLLILLPARAAEYVSYYDQKPRWLLFSIMSATYVVILVTGLYFITEAFFPERTYIYLTGNMSECERDASDYCEGMLVINKVAGKGDRVFLADYYRYWLRPDLIQCLSSTREMQKFDDLTISDEKWRFLYEHGFTYLFVDKTTYGSVIDSLTLENPPKWVNAKLLYSNHNELILAYKLKYTNPPNLQKYSCRQLNAPAWDVVKK